MISYIQYKGYEILHQTFLCISPLFKVVAVAPYITIVVVILTPGRKKLQDCVEYRHV